MAIPPSGPLGFNRINQELGCTAPYATPNSSINSPAYRTLANVPSGTIKVSCFYGKSPAPPPFDVEYLVVAGGGGGGRCGGGGGGGGLVLTNINRPWQLPPQSPAGNVAVGPNILVMTRCSGHCYTVTVGAGGGVAPGAPSPLRLGCPGGTSCVCSTQNPFNTGIVSGGGGGGGFLCTTSPLRQGCNGGSGGGSTLGIYGPQAPTSPFLCRARAATPTAYAPLPLSPGWSAGLGLACVFGANGGAGFNPSPNTTGIGSGGGGGGAGTYRGGCGEDAPPFGGGGYGGWSSTWRGMYIGSGGGGGSADGGSGGRAGGMDPPGAPFSYAGDGGSNTSAATSALASSGSGGGGGGGGTNQLGAAGGSGRVVIGYPGVFDQCQPYQGPQIGTCIALGGDEICTFNWGPSDPRSRTYHIFCNSGVFCWV